MVLIATAVAAAGASAHHGVARYDMDRERILTGTVAAWQWGSPHIRLRLDVSGPEGETVQWHIEGAPPGWMTDKGFAPDTVAPGESVTVKFHPLKADRRGGVLMRLTLADGTSLAVERPEWLGGP